MEAEETVQQQPISRTNNEIRLNNLDSDPSRSSLRHLFVFSNDKAGTQVADKAHVDSVVYETSKNSSYFKNEIRKQKELETSITKIKRKVEDYKRLDKNVQSRMKAACLKSQQKILDNLISTTVSVSDDGKNRQKTFFVHIDMDMFFCAVEIRDDPLLKDKPVAVGDVGMISTANYHARKHGVRAAMPGFIGKKLCPDLVFVRPNFKKYAEAAKPVTLILEQYGNYYQTSVDEGTLDLSDYCNKYGIHDEEAVCGLVAEIRKKIFLTTGGLTCSAGIGPTRLSAKICADVNKPDGQMFVESVKLLEFMKALNVRKIPGIGKVREKVLEELDIRKCGDVLEKMHILKHIYSTKTSTFLERACMGLDEQVCLSDNKQESIPVPVFGFSPPDKEKIITDESQKLREPSSLGKTISCDRTFKATNDLETLSNILSEIAESLGGTLKEEGRESSHLSIKVKYDDFTCKSLSCKLDRTVFEARSIKEKGWELLTKLLSSNTSNSLDKVSNKIKMLQKNNSIEAEPCLYLPDQVESTLAEMKCDSPLISLPAKKFFANSEKKIRLIGMRLAEFSKHFETEQDTDSVANLIRRNYMKRIPFQIEESDNEEFGNSKSVHKIAIPSDLKKQHTSGNKKQKKNQEKMKNQGLPALFAKLQSAAKNKTHNELHYEIID